MMMMVLAFLFRGKAVESQLMSRMEKIMIRCFRQLVRTV